MKKSVMFVMVLLCLVIGFGSVYALDDMEITDEVKVDVAEVEEVVSDEVVVQEDQAMDAEEVAPEEGNEAENLN